MRYLLVAVVLLASIPALGQVRVRDAVMGNAYRCSVVGAPKAWLYCFYGAAQPAREALHLSPAPMAQQQMAQSPPPPPCAGS